MTPIEDAQIRVAKAEDLKAQLHQEIMKKHGSINDLDIACRSDHMAKKNGPRDLRTRYNRATKEVRLAKSDLTRMRNEEQQKPKEWPIEVEGTKDGIALNNVPEEVLEDLGDHGTGTVIGPTPDGKDMIIELDPPRPAYMDAMDRAADKAEASRAMSVVISDEGVSINGRAPVPKEVVSAAIDVIKGRKKTVQHDLEGNKAKALLSGRIKIPPQRFELETPTWVLKGAKEAMLDLVNTNQRPAVKGKVQKGLRAKKDAMINDGDFDAAVERFTDEIMRGIIHRLPEDE